MLSVVQTIQHQMVAGNSELEKDIKECNLGLI
jgi:hypothetical protein